MMNPILIHDILFKEANEVKKQSVFDWLKANPVIAFGLIAFLLTGLFLIPEDIKSGYEEEKIHIATWEEIMAEKDTIKVVKSSLHACELLYEMNTTSWTYGGWRCVKNDFYQEEICGENNDQFCDCICYS